MKTGLTLSMIFTAGQLAFIIVLAVLVLMAIGVNVLFGVMWRLNAERAMHNEDLKNKREALLDKLAYLNSGGEAAPQNWIDFAMFGDEDDETVEPESYGEIAAGVQPPNTVELAVGEMSARARAKMGLKAKVFDNKRYFVRYSLGFDAKLRFSDDDTKAQYAAIMDEIKSYSGAVIEEDFGCRRVFANKELAAKISFMGKRLGVALALDPKEYAGGKFDIEDKSDKKSFAKTPLLVRVKNADNADDVRQLLAFVAQKFSLEKNATQKGRYDLSERTRDELIAHGSVRVVLMGEAE